jgi:hypothetical protein
VELGAGSQLLFGEDDLRAALCSAGAFHDVRTTSAGFDVLGMPVREVSWKDELSFVLLQITPGPWSGVYVVEGRTIEIAVSALGVAEKTAVPSFALVRNGGDGRAKLDVRISDISQSMWHAGEKDLEGVASEPGAAEDFSAVKSRLDLDIARCAHSSGVLPGTGEEIVARLLGASRVKCDDLPRCEEGRSLCNGECRALATDAASCGECGHACGKGQKCEGGKCIDDCPKGEVLCDGACVVLGADSMHCGKCGHACPSGFACSFGECVPLCGEGRTLCGKDCVRTSDDESNCGACGRECTKDKQCVNGRCVAVEEKGAQPAASPHPSSSSVRDEATRRPAAAK